MGRWFTYILLLSFIRLQFVCCCGSFLHCNGLNADSAAEQHACCEGESSACHRMTKDNHEDHDADAASELHACDLASVEVCFHPTLKCNCCTQEDSRRSHRHHLHSLESSLVYLSSKVSPESLVVIFAMPIGHVWDIREPTNLRFLAAHSPLVPRKSILARLGQLRI
jgi:hypothetical protein